MAAENGPARTHGLLNVPPTSVTLLGRRDLATVPKLWPQVRGVLWVVRGSTKAVAKIEAVKAFGINKAQQFFNTRRATGSTAITWKQQNSTSFNKCLNLVREQGTDE